ncbi:PREDICTED: uncharacterized protein LOC104742386 [Camelina sativa]|uniref:Uncharacterized protein LOC104742386 n=1 Tax=Camelina sativa TaxID=90675 RepID=A0ABM0VVI2_CAMSA|nr:PREDICTED: uncharacterized protein LOC104742386 [Camelina sativa]
MWNIAGVPMMLTNWSPLPEDDQPVITSMPLCVTLKNVLHSLFSWEGLGFLTSPIGNPIRLHPDTELCSKFDEAKVFVEVNLTNSLPSSFRFKLNTKEDVTIEFQYPWLPPRCSRCQKWGHSGEGCVTAPMSPKQTLVTDVEEGEIVAHTKAQKTVVSPPIQDTVKPAGSTSPLSAPISVSSQKVDEDQTGWSVVSPGKGCKSAEKAVIPPAAGHDTMLASRFSVLGDAGEGSKETAESEEIPNSISSSVPIVETVKGSSVGAKQSSEWHCPRLSPTSVKALN